MLIKNTVPVNYSDEKKALKISELEAKLNTKENCDSFVIKDIEHRQGKDKSLYMRVYHRDCGNEFHTTSSKFFKNETLTCPECNNIEINREIPDSLIEFISENLSGVELEFNKIKGNYIFDIFIPKLDIALVYYHDKPYKFNTSVRVIQISKNEWENKNELVLAKLREILNIDRAKILHASVCKIRDINNGDKKEFLENYSLYGNDDSDIALGLFSINDKYIQNLVSVMTFKILDNGIFELKSFSTINERFIPGAFGTLLSYFKNNYNYSKILHVPNLCWVDANRNIFLVNKFEKEGELFVIRNK